MINLISITPKAEELIAYMARVSAPENQAKGCDDERLIRYLIKHQHWSPFEMCHMVLEINTTRAIAAQILRHRSFSFQEFSQRYSDVSKLNAAKPPELRRQDRKNRQSSIDDLPDEVVSLRTGQIETLYQQSFSLYQAMIADGVAKECAREILPLGTPTRLYMSGSIRSWLHYVDLRQANGTQLEHQRIALGCRALLEDHLPTICNAMWS